MNRRHGRRLAIGRRVALCLLLPVALALAFFPAASRAVQAEDDENSYTDPDFGWSIAWDPETWMLAASAETATNAEGVAGNQAVIAGVDADTLGAVFVSSQTTFDGDLEVCLETITMEVLLTAGLTDPSEADLDLPDAPEEAERELSFVHLSGGGFGSDGVIYIECRPLPEAEPEALLSIIWLLPRAENYGDTLPDFEALIAGLDLGDADQASAESDAADDAADDADEDNGRAADDEDDDRATVDAEEDDDAAETETETESYTDPIYGWSIAWDPETWAAQEPVPTIGEDGKTGTQVDFHGLDVSLGGVTIASFPAFADDLPACVDFIRPRTSAEVVGDGAFVDNLRQLDGDLPEAPPDAARTLFAWDSGPDDSQISYIECRPLVEDEAVLLIRWTLPVGEPHEAHLPVFEALIAGLDLSEAHAA